jgi:hypothetical protein
VLVGFPKISRNFKLMVKDQEGICNTDLSLCDASQRLY